MNRNHPVSVLVCVLAALALGSTPSRAQSDPGTTAAPILQLPLGARACGMGGAYTGVAADVSALYYNPAGLSTIDYRELSLMYLDGFEDQKIEYIAAVTPLPFRGIVGDGYTSIAASGLFAQNGTIEYNRTNADGTLAGTESLSAGSDLVMTIAYSERVAHFEFGERPGERFTVHHFAGVSGKVIRSTLAERYSANAMAADFGYLVKIPELDAAFGAAVLNVGNRMRFVEEGDPLPMTIRSGISYHPALPDHLALPPKQRLLVAADGEYLSNERQWHVDMGVEYSAMRRFAFRMGYRLNQDVLGLTVGLGAKWRKLAVDYAWGMGGALGSTHRFSFTFRFGRMTRRKREARRRPFIRTMPEREELEGIEEETPREIAPRRRPRRRPAERRRPAPGWIY